MNAGTPSHDAATPTGPRAPHLPPPASRRGIRRAAGATLAQMAAILGVEPETVTAWETGTRAPSPAQAAAYQQLLHVLSAPSNPPQQGGDSPAQPPSAASRPRPARRGRGWSQEEKDHLYTAFRAGTPLEELARTLQRSELSVRWALFHLKLIPFPADAVPEKRIPAQGPRPRAYTVEDKRKINPRAYEAWTNAEETRLAEACAAGDSLEELAAQLGRNAGAIASRLIKINATGPAADAAWESGGDT